MTLWYTKDYKLFKDIRHFLQVPLEYSLLSTYILRLYIKKAKEERIEYLQVNIGYYTNFLLIKKDIIE